MRVRRFWLLMVLAIGAVPLIVAGIIAHQQAVQTATDEVRRGNARAARLAAQRISAVILEQEAIVRTIATSVSPLTKLSPEQANRIANAYSLAFPYIRSFDVVGMDCREIATARLTGEHQDRCSDGRVKAALAGQTVRSEVTLTDDLAPVITVVLPLVLSGEKVGAAIAELDLVGIWDAINDIRLGETGYARVVSRSNVLIGHGDPEERRRVFLKEADPFVEQVKKFEPTVGTEYRNSQKKDVFASWAEVPDVGWTVIVEQPVSEALRGVRLLRLTMIITFVLTVIAAILLGLGAGRRLVRALETMKHQTTEVAGGNLEARVPKVSNLVELQQLADSLNLMTSELARLQSELRAKERLTTFARVAAGLAHDLQAPIEAVRSAYDMALGELPPERVSDGLKQVALSHIPRLHRYVKDLRRLAHEGNVPLELKNVDARSIIDAVLRDASGSVKWRGVKFVADGTAAPVLADESLIGRAVANLVGNAADACLMAHPRPGQVKVTVVDTPANLLVEITDSGVGMSDQTLSDLMVNDFRSTKRNSGVGLGLGVARHVASAHGGTITATSVEGEGSTFVLRIPRQTTVSPFTTTETHGRVQA